MKHFLKQIRHLLYLIVVLFSYTAIAQEIAVTGTVKDKTGSALPGVLVSLKGKKTAVTTNIKGQYSLKALPSDVLQFSLLGFLPASVSINGKTLINVTLTDDVKNLNEVVVIGYGQMKRSDLTGAVGSVSSESIEKSVPTTLDQAIQGRIAGVTVVQNSGIPGGGASIQVRGINSINSTNEPIYVIDGVIISGSTGSNTTNALAGINPSDIESIEVLKDASATAIYGAQAANGVVLVTMKKGKSAKPVISAGAYYGNQELIKAIDMMNLQQYATHYNDLQVALGYPTNRRNDFTNPEALGVGTNWQREIFKSAAMSNYNLSIRGMNNNTTYAISGGYFSQDGITTSTDFKRTTIRVDADTKANNWIKIGSALNLGYTNQNAGIATWSVIPYALFQAPYIPTYSLDGSFGGPATADDANAGFSNPLAFASLTQRNTKNFNTRGNFYTEIKPVKWLTYRTEFSGEANTSNFLYYLPAFTAGSYVNSSTTNQHSKTFSVNWTWRNLLNFNYTFLKSHTLTGVLGQEINNYNSDYLYGQRLYGSSELTGLDAGDANYASNSGNSSNRRFKSVFGRAFYSYKGKYQFTGTLRADGSSNFAEGHQWGIFPSAAVAWRISDESFFKPLTSLVNNFKLRLSYGKVGNSNVGAFAYASMLANVQSNSGTSYQTANIPNTDLTWESTKSWNAGADVSLLKNRIELVFDAYIKKTNNLLMQAQLPSYLGTSGVGSATAPWLNIGSLQNKGFEFLLNTTNISKKQFNWRSALTFSVVRNKITAMNSANSVIDRSYTSITSTYTDVVTRTAIGQPISQFYGYQVIGRINSASDFLEDNGNGTSTVIVPTVSYGKGKIINNSDTNLPAYSYIGDLLYKDVNEDGVINEKDKTFIGNPLPKFTAGFTNNFNYKQFDLSVFTYSSFGNKALNLLRARTDDPRGTNNLRTIADNYARIGYLDGNSSNNNIWNRYVLPGTDPSEVRMGAKDPNNNYSVSSRYVEDASFLRIQNISVGYTLPASLAKRVMVNKLRVYSNIQNVYTFTKFSGYDPEIGSTQGSYSTSGQNMLMYGVDAGRVPTPRIYTIGVDLTL